LIEELNKPGINDNSHILTLEEAYISVGKSNLYALTFEELLVSNTLAIFEKDLRVSYHSHV
jgi:hypothetical protein